jgi:cation diffusion facilitator CzcD-associated flavoprotein CzcO
MLSDVPNFFIFVGYTNASWTLKVIFTSEYISRALHYLDKKNYKAMQARVIETNLHKCHFSTSTQDTLLELPKLYLVKAIKHPGACIKIIL